MKTPNLEIPDVAGEILGWRAWSVIGTPKFPGLTSASRDFLWPPDGWARALCKGHEMCLKAKDKRVPGENCSCGLYAARDRSHLVHLGYNEGEGMVIGRVALVGKVIPGTQGWRAERGRIFELFVPAELTPKLIAGLERIYRVPVIVDDTRSPDYMRYVVVPKPAHRAFVVLDRRQRKLVAAYHDLPAAQTYASMRNEEVRV